MKTKINRIAAKMLVVAWVKDDRDANDDPMEGVEVEAESYLHSREDGLEAEFDLDMGGLQLAYDSREGAWYLQDDPHADEEAEFLRWFKEGMRPSWA